MTVRRISLTEARRIAVRAQRLEASRATDLVEVVEQLTFLQLDPTTAVSPAADLVLWSRLGSRHRPADLASAQADGLVWEHRASEPDNAAIIVMLRPTSQLDIHLAEMIALRDRPGQVTDWLDANAGFRERVVGRLRDDGPLMSGAIADTSEVPWASTGWTGGRNVTQMLEFLASRGVVAVAGRSGKQRRWDLAERVYPAAVVPPEPDVARRRREELRLRALGVARPKWVGDAGIAVEIDGTSQLWRLDPGATADGFEGRTALLSPFDRLIHHYDHGRRTDLFGFEFGIEFYKPKAKRRWGYFVMPVLHHDEIIGKLDIAADRNASRLIVHTVHEDIEFTSAMRSAVDDELSALAAWLDLDEVRLP